MRKLAPNTTYNVQMNSWISEFFLGEFPAQYHMHALARAAERAIKLPSTLSARQGQVVEVRTDSKGVIYHALFRIPYQVDTRQDLVIALDLRQRLVLTAYLNSKYDTHRTLDRTRVK